MKNNNHAAFKIGYIWAALFAAIFSGFAIGAHLSFVIGFEFQLGDGFYSFIQTHGHAQLMGWAGLFIIGVSLHFLPRLAGAPIAQEKWLRPILWLIISGIVLRSFANSLAPYLTESRAFVPTLWIVAASGVLELCGVLIYLLVVLDTLRRAGSAINRPALLSVKLFFIMMLSGWLIYASLNFILLLHMAMTKNVVVSQPWNELAVQVFLGLILFPVIFAFSIRTFPLYLRLVAPDWPVRRFAIVYILCLFLQLTPTLPFVSEAMPLSALQLSSLGMILKGGAISWFVWKLDVLTRRRNPWTVNRVLQPGPDRHPTRPGLPDYGEFGRFERLLYAAYFWLMLGIVLEVLAGASVIFGYSFLQSNDAARHIFFMGFTTQLILGMAVRMIPGFIGKRKIASAKLVDATFWLANVATLLRVLPVVLPSEIFETLPVAVGFSQAAFAFSGIVGMAAVGCLAVNLWKTVSSSGSSEARLPLDGS